MPCWRGVRAREGALEDHRGATHASLRGVRKISPPDRARSPAPESRLRPAAPRARSLPRHAHRHKGESADAHSSRARVSSGCTPPRAHTPTPPHPRARGRAAPRAVGERHELAARQVEQARIAAEAHGAPAILGDQHARIAAPGLVLAAQPVQHAHQRQMSAARHTASSRCVQQSNTRVSSVG